MTSIINTPKALLVEVPEGSYWFELDTPVNNRIVYALGEKDDLTIDLPAGYSYGQPILVGEMGEEDLLNILEFWDSATGGGDYQDYYKNYETETPENYMHLFHFTCPEESFASLLSSHNMKPERTVVIPKTI